MNKINRKRESLLNHMLVLIEEVEILKKRLKLHDTGHIHTTIGMLETRIVEIKLEIITNE